MLLKDEVLFFADSHTTYISFRVSSNRRELLVWAI